MRSSSRPDNKPVIGPQQELRSESPSEKQKSGISLRQPPWHVWVLGAVTFKLYLVYWAYKNWRDLSAHVHGEAACAPTSSRVPPVEDEAAESDLRSRFCADAASEPGPMSARESASSADSDTDLATEQKTPPVLEGFLSRLAPDHLASFRDCSPVLRAIWMVVPYVNNYLLLTLALGIARIHPDKNSIVARKPLLCACAAVFATITFSMLSVLPGAWYLLFLLCILPAAVVQVWLNSYWKAVEPDGLLYRAAFTLRELVVVAVGALCLGYIIVGFLMGPTLKV
ncbi:MAG: hypothetical protein K2W95_10710 [Candidatus Obscuribacterales bacterium]|nr:hypothetical protein [Candidatus Obscuribacterales bacterium]